MYHVIDYATSLFHSGRPASSGWASINCPACHHNGEPSPDTKKKMGVKLDAGGIRFHCFRCGFSTGWNPGQVLSNKLRKLLIWGGGDPKEIMQINLECIRIQQGFFAENKNEEDKIIYSRKQLLPSDSKRFDYWANQNTIDPRFYKTVEYIIGRNENFLEWFDDFHWTPEMPDYIIIPLRHNNYIYGWSARLCRAPKNSTEPRYMLENRAKFLFGADRLYNFNSNSIILVEGPLDAIALDGVAIMGNQITDRQMKMLKSTDKEIIVLADRDEAGINLIDIAIDNGWSVSFPPIHDLKIKDGLDMVSYFGKLFALKLIFEHKISNPLKIEMMKNKWL